MTSCVDRGGFHDELAVIHLHDWRLVPAGVDTADCAVFSEAEATADGSAIAGALAVLCERPAGEFAVPEISPKSAAVPAAAAVDAACPRVDAAKASKRCGRSDYIPILVDCSASMGGKDDASGKTRLDIARELLLKRISELGPNQKLALFSFADTGRRLTEFTSDDES